MKLLVLAKRDKYEVVSSYYWQLTDALGLGRGSSMNSVMTTFVKIKMGGILELARLMVSYSNGAFILFPYLRSYTAALIRYCETPNDLLNALNLDDHDESTIVKILGMTFEEAKVIYAGSFIGHLD